MSNLEEDVERGQIFESTAGESASTSYRGEDFLEETLQFVDSSYIDDTMDNETNNKDSLQTISKLKSSSGESEDLYSDDDFESTEYNDSTKELSTDITTEVFTDNIEEIEAKEQFLKQKIDILKNKPLSLNNHVVQITDQRLQSYEYNTRKINVLRNKFKSKKVKQTTEQSLKSNTQKVLKNTRKLEQLKIENTIFEVEKKIASPLHQPRKCKTCRQMRSKLSENEYVKRKTAQLSKQQFSDDLEKHLYQKDSVTLIADIINSGPNSSDPPQEIWDRLLRKGKSTC